MLLLIREDDGGGENDPTGAEARELVDRAHRLFVENWQIDAAKVIKASVSSADMAKRVLASCGRNDDGFLFVYWVGHGRTDEHGESSLRCGADEKERLRWDELRDCLVPLTRNMNLVFFLGACYSGGMFSPWLSSSDHSNLFAITSCGKGELQGTWSWYEFLRQLSSKSSPSRSFMYIVNRMRGLDASKTFVDPHSRGEPLDGKSIRCFGSRKLGGTVTLGDFFSQPRPLVFKQRDIVKYMNSLPSSLGYSEDMVVSASKLFAKKDASCDKFLEHLKRRGWVLLEVEESEFAANVRETMLAIQDFFISATETEKFEIFMRDIGMNRGQNDCGYAVNPGVFEQFKFLYTKDCEMNPEYPWPKYNQNELKQRVLGYYRYVEAMARRLGLILADLVPEENGGIPSEWAKLLDPKPEPEGFISNGDCRFFRYLGASEMSDGSFVGEIHVDIGLITVSPISMTNGIHILDRKDMIWYQPEETLLENRSRPLFVIWLGDIARLLTGGYLAGTVHRVRLNPGSNEDRYSMPFFIRAREGVPVRCLTPKAEETYASYEDFFSQRFRHTQCTAFFDYMPPF